MSISQALMLTDMVQYGMRRLTDAMQQMTSIERIVQYTEIEPVSYINFIKKLTTELKIMK